MKHADYEIVQIDEDKIFIIDLDLGSISVTNDAEYIYLEIQNNFPGKRLIYRDTMMNWDEIGRTIDNNYHRRVFFSFYQGQTPDESKFTRFPSSSLMTRSEF
jgi:hypothetical protein